MTISEAARKLQSGKVSSVELVRASLASIERLNPTLNAFITVTADAALAQAEASDVRRAAGEACGPLCGIPVALKDVFATRGVRTTCRSQNLRASHPGA